MESQKPDKSRLRDSESLLNTKGDFYADQKSDNE